MAVLRATLKSFRMVQVWSFLVCPVREARRQWQGKTPHLTINSLESVWRPLEGLTFFFDFSDIPGAKPLRFRDSLHFPERCYGELKAERYPDLDVERQGKECSGNG